MTRRVIGHTFLARLKDADTCLQSDWTGNTCRYPESDPIHHWTSYDISVATKRITFEAMAERFEEYSERFRKSAESQRGTDWVSDVAGFRVPSWIISLQWQQAWDAAAKALREEVEKDGYPISQRTDQE